MIHRDDNHDWLWYAEYFCAHLSLCKASDGQSWCIVNRDMTRVVEFMEFFLQHTELGEAGRTMLCRVILESVRDLLMYRAFLPREEELFQSVVPMFIADPYTCDEFQWFWEKPGTEESELGKWINARLPSWVPPPSIWDRPDGGS